jgi:5-formyltetrahydrofolate cyclo-ligase
MSDIDRTRDLKAELRRMAMARREALPATERIEAAQAIAARGLPVEAAAGMIVSGYSPLKSEISPMPLLRRCADAGAALALPVVIGRGKPLVMRAWAFGAPLDSGVWGIRQPTPAAPEVFPDILIVPLLAFDRRGHRIGYGAGYYDRSIEALRGGNRTIAVGLAFAVQEIDAVPALPHDAVLDYVLTETQTFDFRSS